MYTYRSRDLSFPPRWKFQCRNLQVQRDLLPSTQILCPNNRWKYLIQVGIDSRQPLLYMKYAELFWRAIDEQEKGT
jgi:hypothetical protein